MAIEAARLMVHVGADTGDAERGLNTLSGKLEGTAKKAGITGGILTAGVTLPLLGMAKAAVTGAMDMESSLNLFQAVSGASAEQMQQVSQRAIDLGADLTLPATSAADATTAMVELAKSGLSVEESLAAAQGVLQLSAAGNLSNARSAEIAANALNSFGLAGTEATRIADLLAAGANASSAEVFDLADSLAMSGAVFAAAGVPIEDLVTNIGLMANAGIKGSDAGTSLKQMMLSLQAPSDKAKNLMNDLGFSVYDLAGNMLPMREIIGNLNTSMGDLTQEQRNAALATIFGSDAVRAANVLMAAGVDGFDEMSGAVNRQGSAADLAGARMKGLGGAIEGLKSQVETVGTALASKLLPPAERFVRWLADLVGRIGDVNPQILAMVGAFLAVIAGAGPVLLLISGLAAALAFLLSPIGLVVVGLAALAAAFAGNVGGIRDGLMPVLKQFGEWLLGTGLPALQQVAGFVQTVFSYAWVLARDAILTFIQALQGDWTNAEGIRPLHQVIGQIGTFIREQAIPAIQELATFVTGTLWPAITGFVDAALPRLLEFSDWFQTTALPAIQEFATQVQEFFNNVIAPAIQTMVNDVLPSLIEAWNQIRDEVIPTVESLGEIVKTNFENMQTIVTTVTGVIDDILTEHGETIKGIISEAWDHISNTIDNAITIVSNIIQTVMNLIQGDWDGAWQNVKNIAAAVWDEIVSTIELAFDIVTTVFDAGMDVIESLWLSAWNALKSAVVGVFGEIMGAVTGLVGDIASAFSGLAGQMYGIGRDIALGLANGIRDFAGNAISAAAGLAADAWNAARNFLESKSPSKKFIDLGNDVVEGLAIGLSDSGEATEESRKLAQSIVDEWRQRIGDIGGLVDGTLMNDLVADIESLNAGLQAAVELGAPQALIDGILASINAAETRLAHAGELAGTAIVQGMIDQAKAGQAQEQIAEWWRTVLGDLESVIDGTTRADLQGSIDSLMTQLRVAIASGAPQEIIDELEREIGARQADLARVGGLMADPVVAGMIEEFARSQAANDFWDLILGNMGDLASGDLAKRLTQEIADLQQQIALATLSGAPQAIIDELARQLTTKQGQLADLGVVIQEGIAAGILTDPNAVVPISDAILAQIRALSPTLANQGAELSKPLTDAFLSGRLSADQFLSMFPVDILRDTVLPELERLEDALVVDLATAMLAGGDGVDVLNEKLRLLAELLGLIKSEAAAVTFDDGFLITGPGAGEVGSQGQGQRPRYGPVAAGYVPPSVPAGSLTETQAGFESEFASAQRTTPQMLTAHIYLPSGDLWTTELTQILEDERRRPLN